MIIHRWLSKWGMKLASEKRMRELTPEWAPDDIEGELMPFSFAVKETEEVRAAPCVYTPNLLSRVITFMEALSRY